MIRVFTSFLFTFTIFNLLASDSSYYQNLVTSEGGAYFQAPDDWTLLEPEQLPKSIIMLAKGAGKREVSPSINLAKENVTLTLREYLKVVREINEAEGRNWKELGTIQTASGPASLSQCDYTDQWGDSRMLHAITVQNNTAYILTASALKEEFPDHYELFFQSIQSLHLPKN